MLLAGGANIILQLALPAVGYGVAESRVESGSILHHPIKRSRTTFTYLAVAMMGTSEEKLAYRRAVNRSHAQVHSTEDSPVKYNAFDENLQMWVAACLYWGFVDTHQKLHGPMSQQEQETFTSWPTRWGPRCKCGRIPGRKTWRRLTPTGRKVCRSCTSTSASASI